MEGIEAGLSEATRCLIDADAAGAAADGPRELLALEAAGDELLSVAESSALSSAHLRAVIIRGADVWAAANECRVTPLRDSDARVASRAPGRAATGLWDPFSLLQRLADSTTFAAHVTPALLVPPAAWRQDAARLPGVHVKIEALELLATAATRLSASLRLDFPAPADVVADEIALCNATVDEVRAFCKENLSGYKVPSEVAFLEALPVTSVGKPDRKTLRQMQLDGKLG